MIVGWVNWRIGLLEVGRRGRSNVGERENFPGKGTRGEVCSWMMAGRSSR